MSVRIYCLSFSFAARLPVCPSLRLSVLCASDKKVKAALRLLISALVRLLYTYVDRQHEWSSVTNKQIINRSSVAAVAFSPVELRSCQQTKSITAYANVCAYVRFYSLMITYKVLTVCQSVELFSLCLVYW